VAENGRKKEKIERLDGELGLAAVAGSGSWCGVVVPGSMLAFFVLRVQATKGAVMVVAVGSSINTTHSSTL